MRNSLFIILLFITTISYSQVLPKDTTKLSFDNDLLRIDYVPTINYWEYVIGKNTYFDAKQKFATFKIIISNKNVYIRRSNFFYYRQKGRKWKFIY